MDLIIERDPPTNRIGSCTDGPREKHFTEAAIMLAFAAHLLATVPGARRITICPDGEHAKRFDIRAFLSACSFQRIQPLGTTSYGGIYTRDDDTIIVTPKSGMGDVVVETDDHRVLAECKGGVVNTRHAGQLSKLRKGLCEAVGLLVASQFRGRRIAVVPHTDGTLRLARQMMHQATQIGIEIALVRPDGSIVYVEADERTPSP